MPVPLLLIVIMLMLPPGLILLAMGSFSRRGGKCRGCGYTRAGLREGAACPECGGADWEFRSIQRSRWQVIVGGALVGVTVFAVLELARVFSA